MLYGREKKKAFVQFPSTCGFVVKCLKKRQGEFEKNETVLIREHLETGS